MKKINVAIIDNEVNLILEKQKINKFYVEYKKVLKYQGGVNNITHGDICTIEFIHFASNYELYTINVWKSLERAGGIDELLLAFKWCINNKIDLVHMSIGTSNFNNFNKIKIGIEEMIKNNIVVVAAADNDGFITYPASLENVIGVKYGESISNGQYIYNTKPKDGIDITAKGEYSRGIFNKYLKDIKIKDAVEKCNSYTAPFITAKVCKLMSEGAISVNEIKGRLKINADKINNSSSCSMKKSCIYEEFKLFNKEIEAPNIVIYLSCFVQVEKEMLKFVSYFRKEGYNAIGISKKLKRNRIEEGLYKVDNYLKEEMELIVCMTNADVMVTFIDNYIDLSLLKNSKLNDIIIFFDDGIYKMFINSKSFIFDDIKELSKECIKILT